MDYDRAERWLFSLINYEKTPKRGPKSLLDFLNLLSLFDHPEEKLNSPIIVRGTKGKGSTSMMLAQILSNNGYRTGLFTSPHLISVRERIQIGSEYIKKTEFANLIEEISTHIEKKRGIRTYFEVLTLLAIKYFKNLSAPYSVFEAGLGGRLDTTRLINAKIHVLTEIGYDHTNILGNSLMDITFEKVSGVDNGELITLRQHPKVSYVLNEMAKMRHIKLTIENKDFAITNVEYYKEGTIVNIDTLKAGKLQITIPLVGRFLVKSAALACMSSLSLGITDCNLSHLELPARFEKVYEDPLIIIDGSHNPMSLSNLLRELKFYYGNYKGEKTLVFAIMKDKRIKESLYILKDFFDRFIFTEANTPRSEKRGNIQALFSSISSKPSEVMSQEEFLEQLSKRDGLFMITGSFFLAGDIIKYLAKKGIYSGKKLYSVIE